MGLCCCFIRSQPETWNHSPPRPPPTETGDPDSFKGGTPEVFGYFDFRRSSLECFWFWGAECWVFQGPRPGPASVCQYLFRCACVAASVCHAKSVCPLHVFGPHGACFLCRVFPRGSDQDKGERKTTRTEAAALENAGAGGVGVAPSAVPPPPPPLGLGCPAPGHFSPRYHPRAMTAPGRRN